MTEITTNNLFIIIFQSIFLSWIVLKLLCLARPNFLNFFYISSGKSTSNARLLGGLSIATPLLFLIIQISPESTFYSLFFPLSLMTIFGYLDDKFELRARFKLFFQITSVGSFAYGTCHWISPHHPILAFIISSFVGLALINGSNLLDGLDTLTVKLGTTISLGFLYLAFFTHNIFVIFLSLSLISSFAVFYFFNREPAKIYMGEIGGGVIGFIYYVQASFLYIDLTQKMNAYHALGFVMIVASLPIIELSISFLRRIFSKKSPFRGDQFHLHYILKNKYFFSASKASSIFGISNLVFISLGFILAKIYSPFLIFLTFAVIQFCLYLKICLKTWKNDLANNEMANVFEIFQGKIVNIIDSNQFNSLDILILKDKGESEIATEEKRAQA